MGVPRAAGGGALRMFRAKNAAATCVDFNSSGQVTSTPGKECLPRKEIAFTLSDSPDVCVLWCEIIFHVDDFRRARWVDSWFVFRVVNWSFQNPDSCRLKVWVTTCTWHREFRFMRGHRSIASRLTGCFIVDGIECASIFEERLIITHNFIPMETGSA